MSTLKSFGPLSIESFLSEYWQKKALYTKNALPGFVSPLSPDEIAGFALDEDVESRLLVEDSGIDELEIEEPGKNRWSYTAGPLSEDDFSKLPETHWTLLIQHLDSLDPDANDLLKCFQFLPNWRLDDIMVSFASPGGGVGPHFDYYDVFLIQGQGKRRWRLGQYCDASSALVPNQAMKILEDFELSAEYICEPGDILYIPAGVAHWGEAIDDCITYSVGFRAPSFGDALSELQIQLSESVDPDKRYRDPLPFKQQKHRGELRRDAVDVFRNELIKLIDQPDEIIRWLGQNSSSLYPGVEPAELPLDFVSNNDISEGEPFTLSPYCRALYYPYPDHALLFINGEQYRCSIEFAQSLTSGRSISKSSLGATDQTLARELCDLSLLVQA
ncbi:MAG: 50S ribosomal protein L16 3-hydroxylase [Flavobacteriales bacterium]|jgi:50S ribosomal protein L16 3-hydroxylase